MTHVSFDRLVDVLVVGSGGGGMTAALAADAAGLTTLVVEKSSQFGGSTALSGGGIWVPGAPAQRRAGYTPPPDEVFEYLRHITDGLVSDARMRQYVDSAPEMMDFLEKLSPWLEFVWKPGYADYYPELPGGSELGSTINVPPIDLRDAGRRGAEPADAAGAGAARNLAGPQGASLVLPGAPVLGRQGRPGEAGLADGPGPRLRRPDGRHRPVAGRAAAAGDEGPRHPALAGRADDAADHRRRRLGDRRGRHERRYPAADRRQRAA